jgi:hypothetical protein
MRRVQVCANAWRAHADAYVQRLPTCSEEKMASKKAALGGSLTTVRHNDICRVLGKWRQVVKDGVVA